VCWGVCWRLPLERGDHGDRQRQLRGDGIRVPRDAGDHVEGVLFAIVLGSVGGLFPASNAARKQILTALREV